MSPSPEQIIGTLAAEAIDSIGGRPVIAAVLLHCLDDGDGSLWSAHIPNGQPFVVTRGLVEVYRDALTDHGGDR